MTSPLTIGLVQMTEPLEHMLYLPYSIGLLQSYALAHTPTPDRYRFLPLVFRREAIETVLPRLLGADVVGFSIHIWNNLYTLALAQALKQHSPQTLIVFGGPNVPDQPEVFLRENPFVDVAVHGEGEQPFLALIESLPDKQNWQQIPGISWLEPLGQQSVFQTNGHAPPISNLDEIPSPYLDGTFTALVESDPEQPWAAIWETNRGCPFSCTFCDWGALKSKVRRFEDSRVQAEIDWFGQHHLELVYCTDANFGILPRDLQIARSLIQSKYKTGFPRGVLVQMTKNQAERSFQAFKDLNDAKMLPRIPLSLQSVTPDVLKAIKRDNISLDTYHELLKRFVGAGISTYTDFLIGLPGETFESFLNGIDTVINQGQHEELRFWNTYLLPNAEMSAPEYRQQYGIQTIKVPYVLPFTSLAPPVDGIREQIEILVATDTMSQSDWVRMRCLAWMTQILYYSRFLQLPLLLLHEFAGIRHRDLLMAFAEDPLPPETPLFTYMRGLLKHRAEDILTGKPEYFQSVSPQNGQPVWMPTNHYIFEELGKGHWLNQAYAECHLILNHLAQKLGALLPQGLLPESVLLAQGLHQTGRSTAGFNATFSYNLWDAYQQILTGHKPVLRQGTHRLRCRDMQLGQLEVNEEALV